VNADGVCTKATANAIVSQGMLDSLKRVFEALGSESTTEGADKLQKLAARTAMRRLWCRICCSRWTGCLIRRCTIRPGWPARC
jgi:hypothetical protein